jgi:2-dehydro-3-deoxyphosphogluconate aldolase/(4S)-4-hydroxy-2-oxoglutarate aldolase
MTMAGTSREEASRELREAGLIAIIRGNYPLDSLRSIADALEEGGVRVMEITLGSTDALKGISVLRRHVKNRLLVGAGTVRTAQDAKRALEAGAQFLVSPNFDPASAARAREAGLLHLPGVFTASEAQNALAAGCQMQKLFPASEVSPSYLHALRAPLSDIDFVPTGGIDSGRIAPFVEAGAVAFGVGSALIAGPDQPQDDIKRRARRLVTALQEARAA